MKHTAALPVVVLEAATDGARSMPAVAPAAARGDVIDHRVLPIPKLRAAVVTH